MVASRRPQRLPLAASISRTTSASVRCSRRRSSELARRRGMAVWLASGGDQPEAWFPHVFGLSVHDSARMKGLL
jgi:hypothetical protein